MLNIKVFDGKITEHFSIAEFACHNAHEVLLNAEVIDHIQRLEKFRAWYNRAMAVNSGYRTKAYNAKVGGASNSFHVKGIATDIALPNEFYTFSKDRREQFLSNVRDKWFHLCGQDGKGGGVGLYASPGRLKAGAGFFHLDSRPGKAAYWRE